MDLFKALFWTDEFNAFKDEASAGTLKSFTLIGPMFA